MRVGDVRTVRRWKDFRQQSLHESLVSNEHVEVIVCSAFVLFSRTNRREALSGKFKLTTGENRGVFNIRYERFPDFLSFNTTLTVLHTDYDNFAILWTCRNLNQYGHAESSWLLTRDQVPTEEVLQSSYGFLDKFGLRNFFIKSDQTNCDP